MNINIVNEKLENLKDKIVSVFLFEDEKFESDIKELEILSENFDKKSNNIKIMNVLIGSEIANICLVGLGKKSELDNNTLRNIGGSLVRKIKSIIKNEDLHNVHFINLNLEEDKINKLVEGTLLGNYEFNKYKSDKKIKNINLNIHINEDINIDEAKLLSDACIIAKDLVNEPANVMYPETLANEVIRLGKEYNFEVEVYDEEKIKELNMEAYLSVAKGSANRPKFIVMRSMKSDDKEILGLVGKGLTFDTGGYSIKPTPSMLNMKTDMAGAASVVGAMCAISKTNKDKNIISVIAACENAISNEAYKPGDIINSMGGKTIEVVNTDAEGRLTLVDALYYIINNEKVTKVVDIATLTGAAITALGESISPVVTNNDEFYNEVEKASKLAGEMIWKMPVCDDYKKLIKGTEADLKNSGGPKAGCITAGLFIGEFAGDTPWIHIDIAGTSVSSKNDGHKSKGATGEGVRTLYYLSK